MATGVSTASTPAAPAAPGEACRRRRAPSGAETPDDRYASAGGCYERGDAVPAERAYYPGWPRRRHGPQMA